jgi:hypothetical protein
MSDLASPCVILIERTSSRARKVAQVIEVSGSSDTANVFISAPCEEYPAQYPCQCRRAPCHHSSSAQRTPRFSARAARRCEGTISTISRRFGGGAIDAPATARRGVALLLDEAGRGLLRACFRGNDVY